MFFVFKISFLFVIFIDGKNLKVLVRDIKIFMYMFKRKDKGGKGFMENILKFIEDVFKVKKKIKFGFIKSFFGRKRFVDLFICLVL